MVGKRITKAAQPPDRRFWNTARPILLPFLLAEHVLWTTMTHLPHGMNLAMPLCNGRAQILHWAKPCWATTVLSGEVVTVSFHIRQILSTTASRSNSKQANKGGAEAPPFQYAVSFFQTTTLVVLITKHSSHPASAGEQYTQDLSSHSKVHTA